MKSFLFLVLLPFTFAHKELNTVEELLSSTPRLRPALAEGTDADITLGKEQQLLSCAPTLRIKVSCVFITCKGHRTVSNTEI
jgi:hypothetical protein